MNTLAKRKDELEGVTVFGGQMDNQVDFFDPEYDGHINTFSCFLGNMGRRGVKNGVTVFTTPQLSLIERWVNTVAKPNVTMLTVSAPDKNGYMSYGAAGVAYCEIAVRHSDTVILQVNRNMPYVVGESNLIHISDADAVVMYDEELLTVPEVIDETSSRIAEHVLDLIPDGACLQLGIGGAANAIGHGLKTKNDLGVHTEMFTDSMMMLQKEGVITNALKNLHRGKSVVSFALGSKELYEWVDNNNTIMFLPFPYVTDPFVIAQNDNMISINTAMAVDVYGQIAADALGFRQQSSVGGQLDFVRGAQRSKGGKSIIVLPSTLEKNGVKKSRTNVALPLGTSITTTRSDVQYVATEFGCVDLSLLPMNERAKAMISLAHPDFRNDLEAEAKEYGII